MPVNERPSAASPTVIGIEPERGAGGMATVDLAHDVRHDRQVANRPSAPDAPRFRSSC